MLNLGVLNIKTRLDNSEFNTQMSRLGQLINQHSANFSKTFNTNFAQVTQSGKLKDLQKNILATSNTMEGFNARLLAGSVNGKKMVEQAGLLSQPLTKIGLEAKKASKSMDGLANSSSSTAKVLLNFAGSFIAYQGISFFTGILEDSVTAIRDFGRELADVSTLTDLNVNRMKMDLLDLSNYLGMPADNARALYEAISAGVRGSEAELVSFVGQMSMLAKTVRATPEATMNAMTKLMNAYGKEISDARDLSDSFFTTIKLGKIRGEELAQGLGLVVNTAASAGLSVDQLNAGIATLSRTMNASQAIISMNQMLNAIIRPTKEARDLAAQLGLEFDITALKTRGFNAILNDVRVAAEGDAEVLRTLFGNIRAGRAAAALAGDQFNKFIEIQGEFATKAGASAEAFDKQKKSLDAYANSTEVAKEKAKIAIGEAIEPMTKAVYDLGRAWAEGDLSDGMALLATLPVTGFTELAGMTNLSPQNKLKEATKIYDNITDSLKEQMDNFRSVYGETKKYKDVLDQVATALRQKPEGLFQTRDAIKEVLRLQKLIPETMRGLRQGTGQTDPVAEAREKLNFYNQAANADMSAYYKGEYDSIVKNTDAYRNFNNQSLIGEQTEKDRRKMLQEAKSEIIDSAIELRKVNKEMQIGSSKIRETKDYTVQLKEIEAERKKNIENIKYASALKYLQTMQATADSYDSVSSKIRLLKLETAESTQKITALETSLKDILSVNVSGSVTDEMRVKAAKDIETLKNTIQNERKELFKKQSEISSLYQKQYKGELNYTQKINSEMLKFKEQGLSAYQLQSKEVEVTKNEMKRLKGYIDSLKTSYSEVSDEAEKDAISKNLEKARSSLSKLTDKYKSLNKEISKSSDFSQKFLRINEAMQDVLSRDTQTGGFSTETMSKLFQTYGARSKQIFDKKVSSYQREGFSQSESQQYAFADMAASLSESNERNKDVAQNVATITKLLQEQKGLVFTL